MSDKKKCLYCQSILDTDIHGNSDYCDSDCYYAMKLERNKERYQNDKKLKEAFAKSDNILEMFYNTYGPDKFVQAILLDNAGMDWLISKGEINILELPVKIIGNYGYCLFKNETLKIWKIQLPQTG